MGLLGPPLVVVGVTDTVVDVVGPVVAVLVPPVGVVDMVVPTEVMVG